MSGGSKVQTTRTEPWEQQKPYLERGFEFTEDLYRGGQLNPAYYPGTAMSKAQFGHAHWLSNGQSEGRIF